MQRTTKTPHVDETFGEVPGEAFRRLMEDTAKLDPIGSRRIFRTLHGFNHMASNIAESNMPIDVETHLLLIYRNDAVKKINESKSRVFETVTRTFLINVLKVRYLSYLEKIDGRLHIL